MASFELSLTPECAPVGLVDGADVLATLVLTAALSLRPVVLTPVGFVSLVVLAALVEHVGLEVELVVLVVLAWCDMGRGL